MNQGILAARTQAALVTIEAETQRLGGELTITPTRGDTAHQQLHMLEAIATALAAIDAPIAIVGDKPGQAAEVEAVEAVLTVVKEPDDAAVSDGPKSRRGKSK